MEVKMNYHTMVIRCKDFKAGPVKAQFGLHTMHECSAIRLPNIYGGTQMASIILPIKAAKKIIFIRKSYIG